MTHPSTDPLVKVPTSRNQRRHPLTWMLTIVAILVSGLVPTEAVEAQCNLARRAERSTGGSLQIDSFFASSITGNHVYLEAFGFDGSDFYYQLLTYDISNPGNPILVGQGPLEVDPIFNGGDTVALGTLFIGTSTLGANQGNLLVFEMADPDNPMLIGMLDLPGRIRSLELDGNIIYARSNTQLDAISVADPTNPVSIGTLALPSDNLDQGNLGAPQRDILPVRSGGTLHLVDVSDPSNLTILGSVAAGIPYPTIVGNAVVGIDSTAIQIADITDPSNPILLPSYDTSADISGETEFFCGRATGLVFYALEVDQDNGTVFAYDFTDPANPTYLDEVNSFNLNDTGGIRLEQHGNLLLAHGLTNFTLLDTTTCSILPTITLSPFSQATTEGGPPVVLSVQASHATQYEWRLNGQPVADGPIYSGATTDTLTIQPVLEAGGTYEVVAINGDGEATSSPAIVAITPGLPDPTGGCTFSNEVCAVLNEVDCQTAGGTYLGDDTDCSANVPDPTGACGFSGGECLVVTEANCELVSGTYLGDDTDCATNGPNPTGACTFSGEECTVATESECLIADGTYLGDATDCSFTTPTITNITRGTTHPTLADAIHFTHQFDVIEIGEGRLVEWGFDFGSRDITIRGQGRDKTIIDAAYMGTVFRIRNADQSSIEDLTIRRGSDNALTFVGMPRPTFRRVDIRDCVGGAAVSNNSQRIVRFFGCRFINNSNSGGASAIAASSGTSVKCINCVFSGNTGGNQTIGSSASVFDLVNCTFADNTDNWAVSGGGFPSVQNCVFDGSNPVGSVKPTIPLEYSLLPGGTGTNIDGAPTFVDADNGDYRLAAGSLGIDAADYDFYDGVVGNEGDFDVNGNDRLYDDTDVIDIGVGAFTYLDMGASEYLPETIVPDYCVGDMNTDGAIDGLDMQLFVTALIEGTTCP